MELLSSSWVCAVECSMYIVVVVTAYTRISGPHYGEIEILFKSLFTFFRSYFVPFFSLYSFHLLTWVSWCRPATFYQIAFLVLHFCAHSRWVWAVYIRIVCIGRYLSCLPCATVYSKQFTAHNCLGIRLVQRRRRRWCAERAHNHTSIIITT